VYWRLGRYDDAAANLEQSFLRSQSVGDLLGEARALTNLGIVRALQGRYSAAIDVLQRSLRRFRELDHALGAASSLGNIGIIQFRQGKLTGPSGKAHRVGRHVRGDGAARHGPATLP
jgi:tetratricopeptide (TPR) repeat protein